LRAQVLTGRSTFMELSMNIKPVQTIAVPYTKFPAVINNMADISNCGAGLTLGLLTQDHAMICGIRC